MNYGTDMLSEGQTEVYIKNKHRNLIEKCLRWYFRFQRKIEIKDLTSIRHSYDEIHRGKYGKNFKCPFYGFK